MTIIDDLTSAAKHVASAVDEATVSIGQGGRGTGFVVAPGKVLTNAHNLRDRTTTVSFADGRAVQGAISGVDADGDLVVLDVDTGEAEPLMWADAGPDQGDVVFAAGRGGHRFRVSFGIVSGTERAFRGPRGRRINGSVEHTAPLARGSSGGPVVDQEGRVVAVNTNRVGEGFYLSLPVDQDLRARVDRLAGGESARRRTLGVAVAPSQVAQRLRASVGLSARDGLLVRAVESDSPADRAGIAQGDLLTAVGERGVRTVDDLHAALDASAAFDTLMLTVVRGEDERTVEVRFVEDAGGSADDEAGDASDPSES